MSPGEADRGPTEPDRTGPTRTTDCTDDTDIPDPNHPACLPSVRSVQSVVKPGRARPNRSRLLIYGLLCVLCVEKSGPGTGSGHGIQGLTVPEALADVFRFPRDVSCA
jgi:hypothetical protein